VAGEGAVAPLVQLNELRTEMPTSDKFRDECGVVAIHAHPEAEKLAYLGLHALQHRGQESAGIVNFRREDLASATRPWVGRRYLRPRRAGFDARRSRHWPHSIFDGGRFGVAECASPSLQSNKGTIADRSPMQTGQCSRDSRPAWGQGSIFQTNSDTEVLFT